MSEPPRERVKEIHALALEKDPSERSAFLDSVCGEDHALREEVESLLRSRESMGDFLTSSALERLPELLPRSAPLEAGKRIGSYEIVRVIGAGGAGTVYEAMQARPRRRVALKVLRLGLGTAGAMRRFQEEAEILARLNHPNVATVFEAGVTDVEGDALPWFAMEYVEGARTILEHAEAENLDVPRRLELIATVCSAIHHGHQKGIVHLDVKPGNVLVDESGRPKIIDFGIARVAGVADSTGRDVAGTVGYMSPEQGDPEQPDVDVRSDVYSLGVLLFETLTGKLPVDVAGDPLPEALRRIREEPPLPVSAHRRSLRGDVDAIMAKALEKDRESRYASAASLANDLRRHLTHEPVEAHPGGLLYQTAKFARRRRAAFLAITAVLLVSIAAAVVSGILAIEKEHERRAAEFQAYVANIAAAGAALQGSEVAEARQCLERAPEHLRGWEWRYLLARTDTSARTIPWPHHQTCTGGIGPNGGIVVASGKFQFSRPYEILAWDVASGEVLYSIPTETTAADAFAFNPDGKRLAVGYRDGSLELRHAATGELERELEGHEEFVIAVAFHPSGETLASGARDRTVKIWSASSGELVQTLEGHTDRVIDVAFDPSGERLASGGREGEIRIWSLATGETIRVLRGHGGSVESVAWGPEGRRLASASRDRTVRVWDVETGEPIATGRGHTANVRDVAFGPDGRTVATASYDTTVRLWDAEDGSPLATFLGHTGQAKIVDYLPDGSRVVSFGSEGDVKFWDAARRGGVPALRGHVDCILAVAWSRDGKLLASGAGDATGRLWDPDTCRELACFEGGRKLVTHVGFDPGGSRVLVATQCERARLWSLPEGKLERILTSSWGTCFAIGPEWRTLYLGHTSGDVYATDIGTGQSIGHWPAHADRVTALDVSDEIVASGSKDGSIRISTLPGMRLLAERVVTNGEVYGLSLSPDGQLLAAALRDGTLHLLDVPELRTVAVLRGHLDRVMAVAFSPDGERIASGSDDGTVRLWDADVGRQVAVLKGQGTVRCVAWSPARRGWRSPGGPVQRDPDLGGLPPRVDRPLVPERLLLSGHPDPDAALLVSELDRHANRVGPLAERPQVETLALDDHPLLQVVEDDLDARARDLAGDSGHLALVDETVPLRCERRARDLRREPVPEADAEVRRRARRRPGGGEAEQELQGIAPPTRELRLRLEEEEVRVGESAPVPAELVLAPRQGNRARAVHGVAREPERELRLRIDEVLEVPLALQPELRAGAPEPRRLHEQHGPLGLVLERPAVPGHRQSGDALQQTSDLEGRRVGEVHLLDAEVEEARRDHARPIGLLLVELHHDPLRQDVGLEVPQVDQQVDGAAHRVRVARPDHGVLGGDEALGAGERLDQDVTAVLDDP
ncbi:MAG: WD40 domain-containing protein [Planctomycetota bacterium]